MGDDGKKSGPKPRHQTMQVDVDELYAALEEKGIKPPPGSKPPPLLPGSSPSTAPAEVVVPPSAPVPEESGDTGPKQYALIGLVAVLAALAAWGLSQVVFDDPAPVEEPAGTMELGPIELSD